MGGSLSKGTREIDSSGEGLLGCRCLGGKKNDPVVRDKALG